MFLYNPLKPGNMDLVQCPLPMAGIKIDFPDEGLIYNQLACDWMLRLARIDDM